MGRFYSGDIEGKFWVGIQDSNDVENLVTITPTEEYAWKACNCFAEVECDDYCKFCYETKEEHINDVIEQEEYEDKCLYYEESSQGYSLDKETHYEELVTNMELLKKEIPEEIIKEFEQIEQNNKILDAFTGVFKAAGLCLDFSHDDDKKQLPVLLARYTLGYQIEYCLRTTDSCNINCEY